MNEVKTNMLNSFANLLAAYEHLLDEEINTTIVVEDELGRPTEMIWSRMQQKFVEKAQSQAV